jgi:hypothetical protein
MVRGLILAAAVSVTLSGAYAAVLEGVSMSETRVVGDTQMQLNGDAWHTHLCDRPVSGVATPTRSFIRSRGGSVTPRARPAQLAAWGHPS